MTVRTSLSYRARVRALFTILVLGVGASASGFLAEAQADALLNPATVDEPCPYSDADAPSVAPHDEAPAKATQKDRPC